MLLTKLPIDGFNASLFLMPDGSFHGSIRRMHSLCTEFYTECTNTLVIFSMDSEFRLIDEPKIIEDESGCNKYISWTAGPEDARIIEPGMCIAVACDTNPHWMPEMVLLKYDISTAKIYSIQPLSIQDAPIQIEKNWLILRRWGNEAHALHWLNPFRILRLNLQTGFAQIIFETKYPIFENNTLHCGASLRVPQGFLITARVKSKHDYSHSLWLLLDTDSYSLIALSKPFRFDESPSTNYEMCMSLCLRGDDELIACVGISDAWSGVWSFSLKHIIESLSFI